MAGSYSVMTRTCHVLSEIGTIGKFRGLKLDSRAVFPRHSLKLGTLVSTGVPLNHVGVPRENGRS